MGWDAYATPVDRMWEHCDGRNGLRDPEQDRAFAEAVERAKERAGSYDWLLRVGGLDCSRSAEFLRDATGADVYPSTPRIDGADWPPEMVKMLSEQAVWPEIGEALPEDRWALASAYEFLETCARLGLGIEFSW